MAEAEPVLQVDDLSVHFRVGMGLLGLQSRLLRAVDGVSFDLAGGETLGVVGESGCGKSTLARGVLRLVPLAGGAVRLRGENLAELSRRALRRRRADIQIIFQDPLASLDPRMTVGDLIAEPLWTFRPELARREVRRRVLEMMDRVGLLRRHVNGYPHEFSGGQCQRIGIARALVLEPRIILCDEPVSALDVSVQAQIVNLLTDLQAEMGLSLVFIAHDLSVVQHISHRVMVMYLGRTVELAGREALYRRPWHPYTRALLDAVPIADPRRARDAARRAPPGDLPSPLDPPSGCAFRSRCPFATARCAAEVPALREMADGGRVACHHAETIAAGGTPRD